MRFSCEVEAFSSGEHLSQLFTGLGLLSNERELSFTQIRNRNYASGVLGRPFVKLLVESGERIAIDLSDSDSIDEQQLASVDRYYKRCLLPKNTDGKKVFPYGLNYACYGPGMGWLKRVLWSVVADRDFLKRNALLQIARHVTPIAILIGVDKGRRSSDFRFFEGEPIDRENPEIIFFTRAWSPDRDGLPSELVSERKEMNEMRAECIRRLRKNFGELFHGGFEAEEYALANFADCVVREKEVTLKRTYIQNMKRASICISTTGLQGSTPWKLGEYVAGAKAIVSEPVRHVLPGNFTRGENYLEFNSPDECINAVGKLVEEKSKRLAMMKRNKDYYLQYLRPDKLVLNILEESSN